MDTELKGALQTQPDKGRHPGKQRDAALLLDTRARHRGPRCRKPVWQRFLREPLSRLEGSATRGFGLLPAEPAIHETDVSSL